MEVIGIKDLTDNQQKDLISFKNKGANKNQLMEYALGLYNNIDISMIENLSLSAEQMREIRLGEQEGFDTTIYANYPADKMKEIRYGLECARLDKRDIKKYIKYSVQQLRFINDTYNEGFLPAYIGLFDNINYSVKIMNELKQLVKEGKIRNMTDVPTNPDLSEEENLKIIEKFKNPGLDEKENEVSETINNSNESYTLENLEILENIDKMDDEDIIPEVEEINKDSVSENNNEEDVTDEETIFDEEDSLFTIDSGSNSDDSDMSGIFDF